MAARLYHVAAQAQCTHGGQISTMSANVRVKVSGQAVATEADMSTVAGCPFTVGNKPQPCVRVKWLVPSLRVRVMGQRALLETSAGVTLSAEQVAQGTPMITVTQPRARGT